MTTDFYFRNIVYESRSWKKKSVVICLICVLCAIFRNILTLSLFPSYPPVSIPLQNLKKNKILIIFYVIEHNSGKCLYLCIVRKDKFRL